MFHQVLIQPEDRCVQLFLWPGDESDMKPDCYEMCVIIFGFACSPCAAYYVKNGNALEHHDKCSCRAVKSILVYSGRLMVDDFVDTFDTPKEAIVIAQEVKAIHLDAGFELRNFTSNSSVVVAALVGAEIQKSIAGKESLVTEKLLGLYWQPSDDNLKIDLRFNKVDPRIISGTKRPTKQQLLGVVMSVFNPLWR